MNVIIASKSPVKIEVVKRGFQKLFPEIPFTFEGAPANSGISDQPMSNDEMRTGALGRIAHAKELSPGADYYVGLEGGVEEMYGDLYNCGWVIVESKEGKKGYGRTTAFALPPVIRQLIIHEGLEQSHATDRVLGRSNTKLGTGTIGPLTNDVLDYTSWYTDAVICALIPFCKTELY